MQPIKGGSWGAAGDPGDDLGGEGRLNPWERIRNGQGMRSTAGRKDPESISRFIGSRTGRPARVSVFSGAQTFRNFHRAGGVQEESNRGTNGGTAADGHKKRTAPKSKHRKGTAQHSQHWHGVAKEKTPRHTGLTAAKT